MLLLLSACLETGIVKQDDDPAGQDTSVTDSAPETGGDTVADTSADTWVDTSTDTAVETGDTSGDSGDTAVDTSTETGDSGGDTATETGDTGSPPPIVVAGACSSGYPYTSWSDPGATEPELHVVGVYESQLGTGGAVTVKVTRGAQMVLALTSYSSVDWQVELPAVHDVTEIVISSYDSSSYTFTGAGTAPVTYVGWIGACGYEYPDMHPHSGCETPDLQAKVESYVGRPMASFQGCYSGGDYGISE